MVLCLTTTVSCTCFLILNQLLELSILCSLQLEMNQSTLVSKALHIVMEHTMLPDLGWHPEACEYQISALRENILADRVKTIQDVKDLKLEVAPQPDVVSPYELIVADDIEKSSGNYIAALKRLMETEDLSTIHQPVWCIGLTGNCIFVYHLFFQDTTSHKVKELRKRYWDPYQQLKTYHYLRLALREKYLTLYRAVIARLQQQRERYSQ